MNCYRTNCKEECNELKRKYCIFRITKEQQKVIAKIRKNNYCEICGNETIKDKYKGRWINLCTECGVRGQVA